LRETLCMKCAEIASLMVVKPFFYTAISQSRGNTTNEESIAQAAKAEFLSNLLTTNVHSSEKPNEAFRQVDARRPRRCALRAAYGSPPSSCPAAWLTERRCERSFVILGEWSASISPACWKSRCEPLTRTGLPVLASSPQPSHWTAQHFFN
jgi:hypothetical protein